MSLARTLRTARALRPEQIAHRLWNRARGPWFASPLYARARLAPRKVPVPERFPPSPWPGDAANGQRILAGDIRLLAQDHPLRSPVDWRAFDRSPLWQFTLHSFEWLADLAELDDADAAARARAVIDDWIAAHPRPGTVAWHPYPTSLRLYAWLRNAPLVLAGADAAFEHRFTAALDRQVRHLARVVERDVGGNHLIKNLKALIAAERCLDGPTAPWALGELEREVGRQVLADGGHYERSPSYHLQVLGDLIDLHGLLTQTHESPPWLDDALNRMGGALAFLRHGDGGLALFNDGDVGVPAVLAAVEGLLGNTPVVPRALNETGYYRLPGGETLVLMDAGPCCPDDLPAHAHADTLSFELSAGSQRIVVNCGTYAYQDATWRNRLRGTAAHSTLSVDDENSAEVYDVFRVGRRPRVVAGRMTEAAGDICAEGHHDGYRHRGVVHHRRLTLAADGSRLQGVDRIESLAASRVWRRATAHFHLHPDVEAVEDAATGGIRLRLPDGDTWLFDSADRRLRLADSVYAPRFYEMTETRQIVLDMTAGDGDDTLRWEIRRE